MIRNDAEVGTSVTLKPDLQRIQFRSPDEKRIVQVGPDVVSAHILRPYTSWEDFRQQIAGALDAYVRVVEPPSIAQIGMRYINRLQIGEDPVDLPTYFTSPPNPPEGLPQALESFLTRIVSRYDDAPIKLVTTFADGPTPTGEPEFILDIDLVWAFETPQLPIEGAMEAIDDLRVREREAFEALITDNARSLFDAD